ncbi:MAG TPA: hypothetical protein ACFYD3_00810 [Candidatus Hypogeohydataceae bacterium YC41]
MENYYKLVETLAKQAGGHYRLTTVLVKRVKQLVKGLSSFRTEPTDPIRTAFDEFTGGKLRITGKIEEPALGVEEKKKG